MVGAPFVLICDDTKKIAELMVFTLQHAGYRAEAVTNALEAVKIARRDRPSVILMDVMMPGLDGATASGLMREYPELQGIPVVLVSAMSEDELRRCAQESGAVGYLCKPFRKDGLLESVQRWAPDPVPKSA